MMRAIYVLLFCASLSLAQNYIGIGCTTAYHIDHDCDGYGVGTDPNDPNPLTGQDADDEDATVNTPASMLAKYGTLASFLSTVKGYNPAHIWYLDPASGNDSTCVRDDDTKPCQHWTGAGGMRSKMAAGDAAVLRAGTVDENANYSLPISGVSAAVPSIIMAYPGETAILDHTSTTNYYGFDGQPNYVVVDGLIVDHTGKIGSGYGINLMGAGTRSYFTLRNCEVRHYYTDIISTTGWNHITIENNSLHDAGGEHNIYMGQNSNSGAHVTYLVIRGNLLYKAVRDNLHMNGIFDGAVVDGNIMYSANHSGNGGSGNIALQQGINNSTFSNNIVMYGSAWAFIINDYNDGCPPICPYNQNYNLIVNNTFIHTGRDATGQNLSASGFTAIAVSQGNTQTGHETLDLGNNTYQNNIIIEGATGGAAYNAVVGYYRQPGDIDPLPTDTWLNNILYAPTGAAMLTICSNGTTNCGVHQDLAYFEANAGTFTNNLTSDPKLIAWDAAWYATPDNYNLALQPASPAANAGASTDAPAADIRSVARSAPDIGAYEYTAGEPPVPVAVTTASLPGGVKGIPYSQDLAATGGTAPYSWSVSAGALCGGLSLSGATISGTPTTAQTCSFTVQATDVLSVTDTQDLSITILPAATRPSAVLTGVSAAGVK